MIIRRKGNINIFFLITILLVLGISSAVSTIYLVRITKRTQKPKSGGNTNIQFGKIQKNQINEKKYKQFVYVLEGNIFIGNQKDNQDKQITQTHDNYEVISSTDISYLAFQKVVVTNNRIATKSSDILDQTKDRSKYGLDRDIYLFSIDNSQLQKITQEAKYYYNLQFSPTVKYLAYFFWNNEEIVIIDVKTGQKILSQEIYGGRFPELSYRFIDDNTLIIASVKGGSMQVDGATELSGIAIWQLDIISKKLTKYGVITEFADFPNLEFNLSPKAQNLAYYGKLPKTNPNEATDNWEIFLSDGGGTNARKISSGITPSKMSIGAVFSFSPDNKYLAFFQSNNAEKIEPVLHIYDIGQGKLREIKAVSFSKQLIWDKENNLYFIEFDKIKRINIQSGEIENYLDNVSEIYFP